MTLSEYLFLGVTKGFISTNFCYVHDQPPLSKSEAAADDLDGLDACICCVRVYMDDNERKEVEAE